MFLIMVPKKFLLLVETRYKTALSTSVIKICQDFMDLFDQYCQICSEEKHFKDCVCLFVRFFVHSFVCSFVHSFVPSFFLHSFHSGYRILIDFNVTHLIDSKYYLC